MDLNSFLNSIKDPSITKDQAVAQLKEKSPAEQETICNQLKAGDFTKIAAEMGIGTFKRNAISLYCESYAPPKEGPIVNALDPSLKNIKGKEFIKGQNEVGKLPPRLGEETDKVLPEVGKLPPQEKEEEEHGLNLPNMVGWPKLPDEAFEVKSLPKKSPNQLETDPSFSMPASVNEIDEHYPIIDAPETVDAPLSHESVIGTSSHSSVVSEVVSSETATQAGMLDHAEMALEELKHELAVGSVFQEDDSARVAKIAEISVKLAEAENKVVEARQWFDNWTLAVSMLREDVAAAKASMDPAFANFKSFVDPNQGSSTPVDDEAYLSALIEFKASIPDRTWVMQVEQAQQYFADARRDLEEANRIMDSIAKELAEIK